MKQDVVRSWPRKEQLKTFFAPLLPSLDTERWETTEIMNLMSITDGSQFTAVFCPNGRALIFVNLDQNLDMEVMPISDIRDKMDIGQIVCCEQFLLTELF